MSFSCLLQTRGELIFRSFRTRSCQCEIVLFYIEMVSNHTIRNFVCLVRSRAIPDDSPQGRGNATTNSQSEIDYGRMLRELELNALILKPGSSSFRQALPELLRKKVPSSVPSTTSASEEELETSTPTQSSRDATVTHLSFEEEVEEEEVEEEGNVLNISRYKTIIADKFKMPV